MINLINKFIKYFKLLINTLISFIYKKLENFFIYQLLSF